MYVGGVGEYERMPTIEEFLAFESEWRRHRSAKEEAIRARFGIPPARYYQLLNRVLETREAIELDPILVRRLLRVRDRPRVSQVAIYSRF